MRILWMLLLLITPLKTFANFGFGPCCSGSPCGIIPCDNSCGGAALRQFGTDLSTRISQIGSTSAQLTQTSLESSVSAGEFYLDVGVELSENLFSLLTALSALTNRYSGAIELSTDSWRRFSDHIASIIHENLSGVLNLKTVLSNEKALSEFSIPASSELLLSRVDNGEIYKKLNAKPNQVYQDILLLFEQKTQAENNQQSLKLKEVTRQQSIEDAMLVSPYNEINTPALLSSLGLILHEKETSVKSRIWSQALGKVIAQNLSEEEISLNSDTHIMAYRPMVSSKYQSDLSRQTEAGLYREIMVLQQQQNGLLMSLNQQIQMENLMGAQE